MFERGGLRGASRSLWAARLDQLRQDRFENREHEACCPYGYARAAHSNVTSGQGVHVLNGDRRASGAKSKYDVPSGVHQRLPG